MVPQFRKDGPSRTHEEIVCLWHITAHAKELHEIMKLAMYVAAYLSRDVSRVWCSRDVTTHCHWCIHSDHVSFFYQELACLVAEFADLVLGNGTTGAQLRNGPGSCISILWDK